MADSKKTTETEPETTQAVPNAPLEGLTMVPPPTTSKYVTFPDHLRTDPAENHVTDILDDDTGEKVDERPHWVQVAQIRTEDDTHPVVTFRCECGQEYNVEWTEDVVQDIVLIR